MPPPTLRHAARVITLDEHDRLLLRYKENGGFWATRGGSLKPGESHHDDVDPTRATQPDEIRAWRWWTVDGLSAGDQTVYPIELGHLVAGYLRNGAPTKPLELAG